MTVVAMYKFKTKKKTVSYVYKEPIYILYNAWCKGENKLFFKNNSNFSGDDKNNCILKKINLKFGYGSLTLYFKQNYKIFFSGNFNDISISFDVKEMNLKLFQDQLETLLKSFRVLFTATNTKDIRFEVNKEFIKKINDNIIPE